MKKNDFSTIEKRNIEGVAYVPGAFQKNMFLLLKNGI
jgi:hypothetical protein